jgi:hypothetical protein
MKNYSNSCTLKLLHIKGSVAHPAMSIDMQNQKGIVC